MPLMKSSTLWTCGDATDSGYDLHKSPTVSNYDLRRFTSSCVTLVSRRTAATEATAPYTWGCVAAERQ
jgi:hypothetical protein